MLPVLLLLSPACVLHITEEDRAIDVQAAIHEVHVDIDAGEVRLVGDPTVTGATGTATLQWHQRAPDLEVRVDGDVLTIEGECRSLLAHCAIDLDLRLSPEVDVRVQTGAGDVVTQGMRGPLDLDTGAGELLVDGAATSLLGHTGAGDIIGTDLQAQVATVETGAGRIDLVYAGRFDDLDAETGAGDVDLLVPAGSYAVDVETGVGDVDVVGITPDDHASAAITVRTGAGDVRITGYLPGT